ncbi:MAG: twin-arginine translocase TatA/TatE family subunit [Thermoplasmataceae archaeon]
MFDSPTDWIIIIVLVLVLFGGAKKIPEFARSLGKATGEFTRGKMELEREIKSSFAMSTPAPSVNYIEAAKNLGIDVSNKSEEQIRQEIANKAATKQ